MGCKNAHRCFEHDRFPEGIQFRVDTGLRYAGKTRESAQFGINFRNSDVLYFSDGCCGVGPVDGHFPKFYPVVGRAVRTSIGMGFVVAVTDEKRFHSGRSSKVSFEINRRDGLKTEAVQGISNGNSDERGGRSCEQIAQTHGINARRTTFIGRNQEGI